MREIGNDKVDHYFPKFRIQKVTKSHVFNAQTSTVGDVQSRFHQEVDESLSCRLIDLIAIDNTGNYAAQ